MRPIFSLIFLCSIFTVRAQHVGLVVGRIGDAELPLSDAVVWHKQQNTRVVTDSLGGFRFDLPLEINDTLIIKATGFHTDTFSIHSTTQQIRFVLYESTLLMEVVIKHKKADHNINKLNTLHVEELNSGELRKAACCNLSESFETNASVDVNFTDAISGARKIQLLGLSGLYTQFQIENMPSFRGIESSTGIQRIPGTWIESIQITKGTGSVVNGYESMAGAINLELKKPAEMNPLAVNTYVNQYGRSELNLQSSWKPNKQWAFGTMLHGAKISGSMDMNKDSFWDTPLGSTLAWMNRGSYHGRHMESQFGVTLYQDKKLGGQTHFVSFSQTPLAYGIQLNNSHADAFVKTGFFFKQPYRSAGIIGTIKQNELAARFGNRTYLGQEKRATMQFIYDDIMGTTDNKIRIGSSGQLITYQQLTEGLPYLRQEKIVGVFAELTHTKTRYSFILGNRMDYHQLFGTQYTPRVHGKVILSESLDWRFTCGKGWRVPVLESDNISLLASSKSWILPTQVLPEISWNIGTSLSFKKQLTKVGVTYVSDAYLTKFKNQLIVDRDEQSDAIVYKNIADVSQSMSVQQELGLTFGKQIELRLAHRYLHLLSIFNGQKNSQVLIPQHRLFLNSSVKSKNNRWAADFTCTGYGKSRLPVANSYSNPFVRLNAQLSYTYKIWNLYVGGENLTNYMQPNPILDAKNPFSTTFDATEIWGPTMGMVVYFGINYSLK